MTSPGLLRLACAGCFSRAWHGLLAVLALSLLGACGGGEADPGDAPSALACSMRVNDKPQRLLGCVTLAGVRSHQAALVGIAQRHGGSRETGTPGYAAAVDYVAQVLRSAGYDVRVDAFQAHWFESPTPSVLEQRAPVAEEIPNEVLEYSGSGDVTAPLGVPEVVTACVASDFRGFARGRIALVQRGGCTMAAKVVNAFDAGAVGVVVYNNDQGLIDGTLDPGFTLDLPVVGITHEAGERLRARLDEAVLMHLKTDTVHRTAPSYNVLAESTGGDPGYVVMLGAHLDSVAGTVGSNDNASGVAALLETATQMARVRPVNRLRFAFWGAEEQLLVGSLQYLAGLTAAEKARIALYLNFDMLDSPNPAFLTYGVDGDPPEGVARRSPGGATIEQVFKDYYRQQGVASLTSDLSGSADYASFVWEGIPAGGIHSGAGELKTQQEVQLWGGQARVPHDPCYHQPCDGPGNNSDFALATNADAVAWAALYFAMHRLLPPS